jgi:signal transduction histidine kinase
LDDGDVDLDSRSAKSKCDAHESEERMTDTPDNFDELYGTLKIPTHPSDRPTLITAIRKVAAYSGLSDADLDWFIDRTHEFRFEPGEIMMREGTPAKLMFVLLEGEIRGRKEHGGDGPLFAIEAPTVTGLLPFSRLKNYGLTIRATLPVWGLAYSHTKFGELLQRLPDLSQRLVGMLTDRVRTYTEFEQQSQKLAALGKLSAGLAHELNNPSAAARRSAGILRECLARLREAVRSSSIGPDDCAMLAEREEEIRVSLKPAQYPDEFARVEREETIQTWLETRNVQNAWQLGPLLAEANLSDADLETFAKAAGASLGPELTRFATLLEMDRIADELDNSTARISDLVKAIKEYSYMDQASMQEVDIAKSLDTTLTIMHHKLKRSITVIRNYDPELPKVLAYGSELNQVWTNLIDNAADVMKEGGKLGVRAARDNDYVLVEISDSGPGIPEEIQSRIFEPFFTTKGVGEGTGLGLDIAYRIIRKVKGLITVKSVPGDTRFEVRIPIKPAV